MLALCLLELDIHPVSAFLSWHPNYVDFDREGRLQALQPGVPVTVSTVPGVPVTVRYRTWRLQQPGI